MAMVGMEENKKRWGLRRCKGKGERRVDTTKEVPAQVNIVGDSDRLKGDWPSSI